MIYYDVIPHTFVGSVYVAATDKGLCAVMLGDRTRKRFRKQLAAVFPGEAIKQDPVQIRPYRKELEEYFAGKRDRFTKPVDLRAIQGPFQRKVLRKLKNLPLGQVITYGELASRAGSPRAARAVGAAMAANPVPVVIPCHRVVASSGRLGGFSGGGLPQKRKLLKHEGVKPTREGLLKANR
ncbi:MAG: methylated-DNA--[protein]-cysteine S-methyltransferase [Candidatus Latescibacterota bacterium]|nr:MAG: methylated-DNA--[protein]-cysteine S-methyltransferase [Candidatus Latescibacterota bacterium]